MSSARANARTVDAEQARATGPASAILAAHRGSLVQARAHAAVREALAAGAPVSIEPADDEGHCEQGEWDEEREACDLGALGELGELLMARGLNLSPSECSRLVEELLAKMVCAWDDPECARWMPASTMPPTPVGAAPGASSSSGAAAPTADASVLAALAEAGERVQWREQDALARSLELRVRIERPPRRASN